jgi:hypothetical protein
MGPRIAWDWVPLDMASAPSVEPSRSYQSSCDTQKAGGRHSARQVQPEQAHADP